MPGDREVVSGGEGEVPCMSAVCSGDEVRVIEPQDSDAGVPTKTIQPNSHQRYYTRLVSSSLFRKTVLN